MSSVDNRIVALEFDNKQFQREIRKTAESLREFDADLNNVGSRSALDGLDALNERFSTIRTIGMLTFANLTTSAIEFGASLIKNVINKITTAGMSRAMKLEQAKFLIRGMGQDVEAVMKSANDAVSGTAYGLDAAASAAAKFGAAGLKAGDELTSALKGVAGVAAMTGNSYESISEVFTDAAALGKASGMILSRLEQRGLGVTQIMAKALGTTTEGVKEMAREGEISFKQFAQIMNDAFGEHAQKANETYAGALANVGSALGRIGAEFQSFRMEGLRITFNALIPAINAVKAAMDPVMRMFGLITLISAQKFDGFIKSFIGYDPKTGKASEEFIEKLKTGFQNLSEAMGAVSRSVSRIFSALVWHFRNVFKSDPVGYFIKITEAIRDFTKKAEVSETVAGNIGKIFAALVSVFRLATVVVGGLLKVIGALFGNMSDGSGGLLHVIARIGEFVTWMVWANIEAGHLDAVFNALAKVAGFLGKAIGFLVGGFAKLLGMGLKALFFGIFNAVQLIAIPIKIVSSAIGTMFSAGGPAAEAAAKAFHRVKDAIAALVPSGEGAGKVIGNLKDIFGDFGEWIVSKLPSEETIVKAFGSIGDFFVALVEKIGSIIPTLDQVKGAFSGIGGFFSALWNALTPITGLIASIFNGIAILAGILRDTLLSTTVPLDEVGSTFDEAGGNLDKLKNFLEGVVTGIKRAGEALWGAIAWIGDQISKFLGFENVKSAGKFLERNMSKALMGGVLVIVYKFVTAIQNLTKGDWFGLGRMAEGLAALKHGYKPSTYEKIAASLKNLGIAILLFAGSMWILSKLDLGSAAKGLGQIVAFLGSVTAMMVALSKNVGSGLKFNAIGLMFIEIAAAMLILAGAVKLFSMMKADELTQGFMAISALISVFALAASAMGKLGAGLKGVFAASAGMIAMAVAMTIMIIPIKVLGAMDVKTLAKGVVTLTILIGVMAGFMSLMGVAKTKGIDAGLGLVLMAYGINKLVDVIERLNAMDLGTVAKGGFILAGMLVTLAAIFHMMPDEGDFIKLGAGLLLMSVGINIIARSFERLSGISINQLGASFTAMVGVLAALTIAANQLKDAKEGIIGMVALTAGLFIVSYSLQQLSDISWGKILISALALISIIAALVIAAKIAQTSEAGVMGIVGLAAAVLMVAGAIQVLGELSIAQIITGVLAMVVVIGLLVGLAAGLATLGPATAAAETALLGLAVAALAFAVSAYLLARSFEIIADNAEDGSKALIKILTVIVMFIPRFVAAIGLAFIQLAAEILNALPALIEAFGAVILGLIELGITLVPALMELGIAIMSGLLNGIITIAPLIIEVIMVLITSLLTAINEHIEEFVILGAEILVNFLNGLASMMPDIVAAGANLIVQFLIGLGNNINDIINAGILLLVQFLVGVGRAISTIADTVTDIIEELIHQFAENADQIFDAGYDALVQFLNGLMDFTTEAIDLVLDFVVALLGHIADSVLDATREILDVAINFLNGLADVMDDEGNRLLTAIGRVVRSFLRLMLHGLSGLDNLFGDIAGAIIDGIGNAITAAPRAILELGENLGRNILGGFAGFLGINSPSRKFYEVSKGIPEGIVNALNADKTAYDAAYALGDNTVTAFQRSINNLNYVISTMDEFDPVITPVLDLDGVEKEAQKISDILGGHEFDANLSNLNAGAISAMSRIPVEEPTTPTESTVTEINFEQTINSPEPLTTMDIYNATRSQIQIAKDELSLL